MIVRLVSLFINRHTACIYSIQSICVTHSPAIKEAPMSNVSPRSLKR